MVWAGARPRSAHFPQGGSYIKKDEHGYGYFAARLRGYKGKAARAREPYASSDWDLAEMADRGSTTRGMVILPEGGVG